MLRGKSRAEIVVVARRGADDQADLLTLVEIGDVVGAHGQAGGEGDRERGDGRDRQPSDHLRSSVFSACYGTGRPAVGDGALH
jgi:hypothetical protein